MVENTKQQIRFSNEELQLLKNTFAEREELLFTLRKHMLQLPMPEQEEVSLRKAMSPELAKLLRKLFLPELDGNLPLHQEIDLWLTVKIDDKTPEEAHPHIMARKQLIYYLDQQLSCFAAEAKHYGIILNVLSRMDATSDEGKTKEGNYIDLITRNTAITHVEQQLMQIKMLAGQKDETPEETLKRLRQNSNK